MGSTSEAKGRLRLREISVELFGRDEGLCIIQKVRYGIESPVLAEYSNTYKKRNQFASFRTGPHSIHSLRSLSEVGNCWLRITWVPLRIEDYTGAPACRTD